MSEQDATQTSTLQRPPHDVKEAWKVYWKTQGQPWRTEPEIDTERQRYLAERRSIKPDTEKGIYPFRDMKLSRADVEWLLATHQSGGVIGPVDWNDESQRKRDGLDLQGADLRQANLTGLPLARIQGGRRELGWLETTEEQRSVTAVHLEEATLQGAQLQGAALQKAQLQHANLWEAHLQGASLVDAQLQGVSLVGAQLQGADLWGAQLQQANLYGAQVQGADLRRADLDHVRLDRVTFSDQTGGSAFFADITWGEINLTVVDWKQVTRLGDEEVARQERDSDGKRKDNQTRIDEYKSAVRANRQLAVVLREQGLNEEADQFSYRAQVLQRVVWRRQRSWLKYAFSWFLAVVAGYGYKPYLCFVIYFLSLIGFTLAHYIVGVVDGHSLTLLNALAVSVQSLHGRLFSFQSSDPQTLLNTIEAFVGLFIEAIVVAVITQRILGK